MQTRSNNSLFLLLGALVVGGCGDLTVPDFNNPGIENLQNSPTRAAVRDLATGLLIGARANITD